MSTIQFYTFSTSESTRFWIIFILMLLYYFDLKIEDIFYTKIFQLFTYSTIIIIIIILHCNKQADFLITSGLVRQSLS